MINVLVFPCGSEVAIEVHRALHFEKNINLIGLSSVEDHGKFVFENYIGDCPFFDNNDFIPYLKNIVESNQIDVIYPCMDIVLPILKDNETFLGCKVVTSELETTRICLSKLHTYQVLKETIKVPEIYNEYENINFPLFSKPNIGASSRNTFKIFDELDFSFYTKKFPENLILEYLPGDEFTVDCFTDFNGNLLFSSARKRNRISNGISVNTQIVNDPIFDDWAKKINQKLKFNGAWFFQVKFDKNNILTLLEVASRIAGSSTIQRYRGVNLPLLSIYNILGYPVSIQVNNIEVKLDRGLDVLTKTDFYFENVYFDFDDTIVLKENVNPNVMKIIYSLLNKGIKLFLVTRHRNNIIYTLNKYKISSSIFEAIIHLKSGENKADFIKENSVFVDDSYRERTSLKFNRSVLAIPSDIINILI